MEARCRCTLYGRVAHLNERRYLFRNAASNGMEMKIPDKSGEHRNVLRLLAVLDALSKASAQGLRLTDVIEATGLGKTTAHRILAGLMSQNLAEQDPETGRFFIGVKMLSWATAARDRFSLVRLVEPALVRISRQTQDTVYLVVRSGDDIVCLDCREGAFPIKVLTLNVGDRRPLGIGAGSLAILSALPDAEIDRIFAGNAEAMAAYPFDEVRLRQMIAATRQNGYAYNNVHVLQGLENVTEMAGIGVPIRKRDGMPVAALHLTGVTSRLDPPRRENLVATLHQEARQIEAQLEPVLAMMSTTDRQLAKPGINY
jgi:DNA-binding IclR family transcriptional regulator